MCGDDYDEPAVCDRSWRTARKPHECCACDETIRVGDRYHYTSQLADGSWDTWKHGARCYAICEALWKVTGGESIAYELNCGEDWVENFGDLPPEVAALAFMSPDDAQAHLCGREGAA